MQIETLYGHICNLIDSYIGHDRAEADIETCLTLCPGGSRGWHLLVHGEWGDCGKFARSHHEILRWLEQRAVPMAAAGIEKLIEQRENAS